MTTLPLRLNRIMNDEIIKILMTSDEIDAAVTKLADRINSDYKGKDLLLVGLLKGSVVFLSDLMRKINLPCEIDFMIVSSYGGDTKSSGSVKILSDLSVCITGRDVLIVEDIVDTGTTLSSLLTLLQSRKPKSLKLCTLFDKPSRRINDVKIDYSGAAVPNEFVVGYGMDYNEKYRNLPDLCILNPKVYSDTGCTDE